MHYLKESLMAIVALFLCSCSTQNYSIKGNYSVTNSVETSTSYEQVWANVVNFFAENNIPITIIDKESGIITANRVTLAATELVSPEDKNGQLKYKDAWFVMPCQTNVIYGRVESNFNVRVLKKENGKTSIRINLGVLSCYPIVRYRSAATFQMVEQEMRTPVACRSTGKFESLLLDLFD